jgi:hypothetical protein
MIRIPPDELIFHPHSFADPAGRLFWWDGGLYRGLRADSAALFRRLLYDGTLQRLTDEGLLIDTWPTDLSIDGYQMVVRHRMVPFASYPEEWCPAMLKDAALTLLDLLVELARCGLTLKDAHPWNLLFDRGRPVYVDLASITPLGDERWRNEAEFRRFYLHPLLLMAHNQERIARRLLPEYDGVTQADVTALACGSCLPRPIAAIVRRFKNAVHKELSLARHAQPIAGLCAGEKKNTANSLLRLFSKTRSEIEDIHLPGGAVANEAEDFSQSVASRDSRSQNQCRVRDILAELDPKSVLDIGGSAAGWYSCIAAAGGSATLAMSTDSELLMSLYTLARGKRLPLLPVVMDFTDPTPSRGLCSHWSIAASERLRCEMVLALANIHQYVFQRSLNFEQIAEGLALFSNRWLIAEFVSPEDPIMSKFSLRNASWYNLENFAAALKRRFREVIALPATSPRVLLMCEK